MTFGDALEQAKAGRQIRRDDWPAGDKITCVYTKDLHPYLMMFEGDSEPIPFFYREYGFVRYGLASNYRR